MKYLSAALVFTIAFLPKALTAQKSAEIIVEALAVSMRNPPEIISFDPVSAMIAKGEWQAPAAGSQVAAEDGAQTWETVRAGEDGWFQHAAIRGGYIYVAYESDREKTVLLEGMGNEWAWVNGAFRAGNRYRTKDRFEAWEPPFDYSIVPVRLQKGRNDLLFRCNRGRFKLQIQEVEAGVLFNKKDMTLPDLLIGQEVDGHGAIVLVNARTEPIEQFTISASFNGGKAETLQYLYLPAMSVRKVAFPIKGEKIEKEGASKLKITVSDRAGRVLVEEEIDTRHRDASIPHVRTYISEVDGSVQHFAVNPASGAPSPKALVLSVHGANVEAFNQANSYYPKSWAHIVSPTNRRPYGFNWEDWGRIDALDVLQQAKEIYDIDPDRVYLTGHSMGGHGTWYLGATYPDRFAAIAPSAGYMNLLRYRNRFAPVSGKNWNADLLRASNAGQTDSLASNYAGLGVYILHGGADDVVPPQESRYADTLLAGFHRDYVYHEEPGQGHWWDLSDEAGADCVDWPPIFDFFARHARPGKERIRELDFTTANPEISSRHYWAAIHEQERPLEFSRFQLRIDPSLNRIEGRTSNITVLAIDAEVLDREQPLVLQLDESKLEIPLAEDQEFVFLHKTTVGWQAGPRPDPVRKGPHRYGSLKSAINHRVVFVYGTQGESAENRWAEDKARYDAESFWYQGNGSVEVIPDRLFDPAAYRDRSVVLYGHAQSNGAWDKLLAGAPVRVERGMVRVGERAFEGKSRAAMFVYPRQDSPTASVAVVAGSDLTGMRMTDAVPWLMPGYAFPDVLVFNSAAMEGEEGIDFAGFFGMDWSVQE
jgi:predicted esterase